MIYEVIRHCFYKHLDVLLGQNTPVTIDGGIPVATDGRELCLLVCLVQRAGKWFSSSLALGTNVVTNMTDRLSFDMPCLHDRARRHRPSYF